nr:MAG TPA: hypothetical protein [Caudoviricetes sp.]
MKVRSVVAPLRLGRLWGNMVRGEIHLPMNSSFVFNPFCIHSSKAKIEIGS